MSKEQELISKIDSLLDQVTEHQQSGLTADYRLYFAEGYKYALQEWKNEVESSDLDDFMNNLPSITSKIERSVHNFRKGTSHHPEAIRGRQQANEDINKLIKMIL